LILSPAQYWVRSTDYSAPHYVIFSIPLLPRPSLYHQHNYLLILLSNHKITWENVLTLNVTFRPLHNIKVNDNFMLIVCAVTLRPQSCNYYIIQVACQYKILKSLKYVTAQYNNKNTFNVEDVWLLHCLSWRFLLGLSSDMQ